MKTVYTCFSTDVIHEGHINIINQARQYGEVIVGVLSDSARVKYNTFPLVSLEERIAMLEKVDGIKEIVIQDEVCYDKIIAKYHPDYVIHGDNWKRGHYKFLRDNVEALLKEYGGEIIDVPYTYNDNIRRMNSRATELLGMSEVRRKRLRQLINLCPIVKTMEVHSGLTGLLVEKIRVPDGKVVNQFDAMWLSSLCDSTMKGKPDIEVVDMTSRFRTINDIMEVTTKPIIFDGDTGGLVEHFIYTVRSLERMGVSAIIIEDKIGLKRNSLYGTDVQQTQDSIENFCEKIRAGKKKQLTDDFMIIARIESLILKKGMQDALERARAYTAAGADGIMIHSREKTPDEIIEFCDSFRQENTSTPLVVVPTSYDTITEDELVEHGVNVVIYANQLIRSAFPAMQQTAHDILKYHRSMEVNERLLPIKNIISLIPPL